MKTINERKVALYYGAPYNDRFDDRELVCICEDELVASTYIEELQEERPYAYQYAHRFQMQPIMYVRRAY